MTGEKQGNVWPLPKFYFSVTIGDVGDAIPFQEVNGLDRETQVIEYRAGGANTQLVRKMPGLAKLGNVTLKKGIFPKDNNFWKWYSAIQMNTIRRETVTISLLDQTGKPTMVWTLKNAWPTKITSTDLKSEGNEVAVETLEMAYETLTIRNGG